MNIFFTRSVKQVTLREEFCSSISPNFFLCSISLEKSKKFYSEVLGATFYEANWTGKEFGIEVAISWDAGIELCAPMPGRENDSMISPLLDENG